MSIAGMPQAGESDDLENLSISGLVSLVRQLLVRVEALERENAVLKAENASLREQLRISKRPAAPFSKGPGPGTPKKPGRHPGKGRFERREEPVPGPADRVEELSAPLDCPDCPQCGARLEVTESVATVEGTLRSLSGSSAVSGWSTGSARCADGAGGAGTRALRPVSTGPRRTAPGPMSWRGRSPCTIILDCPCAKSRW